MWKKPDQPQGVCILENYDANPVDRFFEPVDEELFANNVAEVILGMEAFGRLTPEKREATIWFYAPIAEGFFRDNDIAPTLDNILIHKADLEAVVLEQGMQSYGEDWGTDGSWAKSQPMMTMRPISLTPTNVAPVQVKNPNVNLVQSHLDQNGKIDKDKVKLNVGGVLTTLANSAQVIQQLTKPTSQQEQIWAQQGQNANVSQNAAGANIFPKEKKKPKVLGMEPVVGIALILIIFVLLAFSVWSLSKNK
ncbi:hypothetical protein [Hugenholtzia roseola]|uniref:hypothetical protein n=1 Tax=Hugenholtzia roseola TaxID=1002 RepID=UPI0004092876|nr:hypothetical protein [Hugenholtzia roseola]